MEMQLPKTIRGYELHERIGDGGFGAVHRAYQPVVEREVAIKVILPQYANKPSFVRNFEAEARIVAHLEHPFIVPLFDYWRDPDGAYLVMRFFPLGSLKRLLDKQGPLPIQKVSEILMQITGALDTAHRHHVIHRDIKPENILMDEEGNAFMADFGIAKREDQAKDQAKSGGAEQEDFSGTLAYAPPELLNREGSTAQSDIYSLGYVVYEMLTGKHAFADQSPVLLLLSHMEREIPAIEGVPDAAMAALRRATAKVPQDRYTTARAFAIDFQQGLGQHHLPQVVKTSTSDEIANPYKGLRPFDEADAGDFFGRDALLKQILGELNPEKRWSNFLAVVGPSGSGKSSVVHAGLLPALRAGKLPHSNEWFILTMTPGARPLQQLRTALLSIAIDPMDTLSRKLQGGSQGLLEALEEVLQIDHDLLLVIDQFEEVFTLVQDEQERQHFLELLYAAVTAPNSRIHVIITLRADFYDKPLLYENFGALVQARTQVVLPLNTEELELAITGPARRAGLDYDSNLIAAIVADVRQEPGALPLLQYALTEVFERRQSNRLSITAYQDNGRILGALAGRAEDVYNGLNPEQQSVAQQVFLRLVAPGEGTEDTRRRARYSELAALKIPRNTLQSVLDLFSKYRLLTFDRDSETREPTIEVAHEALIRGWNRLRNWLDQGRSDIRLQRLLAAAAEDWRNAGQDKSYLLTGARLAQFEEWVKISKLVLSQEEQTFLEASIAEHQRLRALESERQAHELKLERRSRQRLQMIVGILVVASIIGIGLTLLVYQQSRLAEQQRDTAERKAAEANSLRLGTLAQQSFGQGDTVKALSLALQGVSIENPPAEVLNTLIDVAYAPGLRRIVQGQGDKPITALAISPDGRYVLSGAGESLWESSSGGRPPGPGQPPPPPGGRGAGGPPPPPGGQPPAGNQPSQSGSTPPIGDYTLTLWDRDTGREIQRLQTKGAPISDIIFLPGTVEKPEAISASSDGAIVIWDVLAAKRIEEFKVPSTRKIALSLSDDGSLLLIVGSTVKDDVSQGFQILWDVKARRIAKEVSLQTPGLVNGRLNPNGKTAVSSYDGGIQVIWDTATGEELKRYALWDGMIKIPGYRVDIGSDKVTSVLNIGEPDVLLWSLDTGKEIKRFQAPTVTTLRAALTGDGSKILITARDGALRLWDVKTGTVIRNLLVSDAKFESSVFDQAGRFAITGSSTGQLYFWEIETTPIRELGRFGGGETKQAAFLAGGTQILTLGHLPTAGEKTSHMVVWDVKTGQSLRTFGKGHIYMPQAMAVSQDGKYAVTGAVADVPGVPRVPGRNDAIFVWDIETGAELRRLETTSNISSLAFDPRSGKDKHPYLVAIPQGNDVGLWNVETGDLMRLFKGHSGPPRGLAFTPDGTALASTSRDKGLIFWNTETGDVIRQVEAVGSSGFVVFSSNGQVVATSRGPDVIVWDVAAGKELYILKGHQNGVASFAFSPDSKQALSGSMDNTFILWNLATQEAIHRYDAHDTVVWQVAFSPEQKAFLSAANGLILWRADPITLDEVKTWVNGNRYTPANSATADNAG